MVGGFLGEVGRLVAETRAVDLHEIGCGEGYISAYLAKGGRRRIRGSDLSEPIIDRAQELHGGLGIEFSVKDARALGAQDGAELMICCEVLEHLVDPRTTLEQLRRLARPYCLLSVPREPLWRVLNLARGRYWRDWGNTPGHVQAWSKREFLQLVSDYFEVITASFPIPWTVVLCRSLGA